VTARPSHRSYHPGTFDDFADRASAFVSRPAFFTISLAAVAVWIPTIAVIRSVDTWQLVINTVTSVLAFLLVALLQNSERRSDHALHAKIDSLSEAVVALACYQLDSERESLEREVARLRSTAGLGERS
jgi:low affinity Fe/Cu permease